MQFSWEINPYFITKLIVFLLHSVPTDDEVRWFALAYLNPDRRVNMLGECHAFFCRLILLQPTPPFPVTHSENSHDPNLSLSLFSRWVVEVGAQIRRYKKKRGPLSIFSLCVWTVNKISTVLQNILFVDYHKRSLIFASVNTISRGLPKAFI